jgi:hypothetical protein
LRARIVRQWNVEAGNDAEHHGAARCDLDQLANLGSFAVERTILANGCIEQRDQPAAGDRYHPGDPVAIGMARFGDYVARVHVARPCRMHDAEVGI